MFEYLAESTHVPCGTSAFGGEVRVAWKQYVTELLLVSLVRDRRCEFVLGMLVFACICRKHTD